MINLKVLLVNLVIPYLVGFIGSLFTGFTFELNELSKSPLTPSAIVFPIVWTILYTLMGISSYIIYTSNSSEKKNALSIYAIQLFINSLWTLFFFSFKWYLFSFIWILLLIIAVVTMIYYFYKINKVAGLLQIPYLIWLIFAAILNFMVYIGSMG